MIKKILMYVCVASISTSVLAFANNTVKLHSHNSFDWCLNHDLGRGATCPVGSISLYPQDPNHSMTAIFYVNRSIAHSIKTSDPVRLQCNTVSIIVNPGSSYTCVIPVGGYARWEIEPARLKHGADGVVFEVVE